jgi:hypothetical protein
MANTVVNVVFAIVVAPSKTPVALYEFAAITMIDTSSSLAT